MGHNGFLWLHNKAIHQLYQRGDDVVHRSGARAVDDQSALFAVDPHPGGTFARECVGQQFGNGLLLQVAPLLFARIAA